MVWKLIKQQNVSETISDFNHPCEGINLGVALNTTNTGTTKTVIHPTWTTVSLRRRTLLLSYLFFRKYQTLASYNTTIIFHRFGHTLTADMPDKYVRDSKDEIYFFPILKFPLTNKLWNGALVTPTQFQSDYLTASTATVLNQEHIMVTCRWFHVLGLQYISWMLRISY